MDPIITNTLARDFAANALKLLKHYEEYPVEEKPPEEVKIPAEKPPIEGPGRVLGDTDYSKFDHIEDEEEVEAQKQAEDYVKAMCSQDHRKEIELFERPTQEKLNAAVDFKDKGNDAFKKGNHSLAALFYRKGLLQLDYTFPDTTEEKNEFSAIEQTLHLNMALMKYHLQEYDEVLVHASQVLKASPRHQKALYRKAQVFFLKDSLDETREILEKMIADCPNNKDALELLRDLGAKERKYKARNKQVYKTMINK